MNIAIAIPSPEQISPKFSLDSLPALISYTKQNLKNVGTISLLYQTGVRTDKNRNLMIDKVLKAGNVDYILWLDADMYYQPDIICKYFEFEFDIMGCLYFKRSAPHNPVGYIKGDNPVKPFKQINPLALPKDTIVEVDGLGFGGVMVKTSVYEAMGEDKWMNYGTNYHLPYETEGQLTHDLEWCRNAQKYGFKIYLHTGVKPTHLAEYEVSQTDWERNRVVEPKRESITAIIPTINPEKALETSKTLKDRAGMDFKLVVIEDIEKNGWVATINSAVRNNPSDYYIYLADDVFPSKNWLVEAMKVVKDKDLGLLAFNDGKWFGKMASFGLVKHDWMIKNYNGDLLNPVYRSHYADPEITLLALSDKVFGYAPKSIMMEVHNKTGIPNNKEDQAIFRQRKLSGFEGRITDTKILNLFN